MSYPYSGLSNYSGHYQTSATPGLACYGQSLSSDNLDYSGFASTYAPTFNNCGPQQPSYINCNGIDAHDPKLLQQIDQIVAGLTECKRPILRRQVITVPSQCPGRVAYVTRRLPTPPPDIIERITVVKPPRDVVNLCIEKPTQPGPCYQERNICGKPRKPIIQPRIITVNPRTNPCAPPCPPPCPPPCVPCPPPCMPCPPPCVPCPPPCMPCPPPSCNPCGPPSCNPCGPPPCNPCTPITYIPPGQNFQAQVPLSPSPSSSSLSQTMTQPPALTHQGYTSQAYSQPQLTSQFQPPSYAQQALQQVLSQQGAYPQAAYAQQAAYQQQQQQAAYAQQAAYQQQQQQAAYSQAQGYPQAQPGYTQQQPGYTQQQQGYYPQQQPGQPAYQ